MAGEDNNMGELREYLRRENAKANRGEDSVLVWVVLIGLVVALFLYVSNSTDGPVPCVYPYTDCPDE